MIKEDGPDSGEFEHELEEPESGKYTMGEGAKSGDF